MTTTPQPQPMPYRVAERLARRVLDGSLSGIGPAATAALLTELDNRYAESVDATTEQHTLVARIHAAAVERAELVRELAVVTDERDAALRRAERADLLDDDGTDAADLLNRERV